MGYSDIPLMDAVGTITGSGASGQVSYWSGTNTQTGSAGFTFAANTLSIGDNTSSGHVWVTGLTGRQSSLHFMTNNVVRWDIQKNNTAEGGANAGSDFNIIAYSDAGALIDSPLTILRAASGTITWAAGRNMGVGITPTSKLHLDSGNATASYCKFTAGTTTGTTSTDGFDI